MRVLMVSWGSLGDLHPFLRVGEELLAGGDAVTLAGHPDWEAKVRGVGLDFLAVGGADDFARFFACRRVLSSRWMGIPSMVAIAYRGIEPILADSYRVLSEAAETHDLLVAHQIVLSARSVAERTGIPWVTVAPSPGVVPTGERFPYNMRSWRALGPLRRPINRFGWFSAAVAMAPIYDRVMNRHRRRHGLRPVFNALFEANHSPRLTLVLSSRHLYPVPLDWALSRKMTGFCLWKPEPGAHPADPELETFLADGPAPWLFTLGSAAVAFPGRFYEVAAEAMASQSGERALFLTGENEIAGPVPSNVLVREYLPFDRIMPHCRAVVHQCGAGTMAQVLETGLPSIAVPFAFDQPGNARQLARTGAAEVLPAETFTAVRLSRAMQRLRSGRHAENARNLQARLATETGPQTAARLLRRHGSN